MAKNKPANPMIEMAMKALGIDGASLIDQAKGIGDAFAKLMTGQAELIARTDRAIDMLWTMQLAMGIAPSLPAEGDMAALIASESRKHMGDTIMDPNQLEIAGTQDNFFGPGVIAIASIKLEELLKIRHGIYLNVQLDALNLLSVGIGHRVRSEDQLAEGDFITEEQCLAFYRADATAAMTWAMRQMRAANIRDPDFLPWLASVNFQLGSVWVEEYPSTWALMKGGQYVAAAASLDGSDWYHETPVRVRDFQMALEALAWHRDRAALAAPAGPDPEAR